MNRDISHPESPLLVTAAICIEDSRVLITRRPAGKPHAGFWEFPGGKIQPGEAPEEALAREITEELGVKIKIEQIIEVLHYRYDWGPVLILAYQCIITSGHIQNLEVAEHRWVDIDSLHQFDILPADKPLIAKLQSRIHLEKII